MIIVDTTAIPLEKTGIPIAAIGAGVAVPLVVIILIIIVIVVLVLVVSKRRAQKPYQVHQGKFYYWLALHACPLLQYYPCSELHTENILE